MLPDGLNIARVVELSETVAKVAYSGKDEFLSGLSVPISSSFGQLNLVGCEGLYLCLFYIFRRLDPFDLVADLLNRIDQRSNVASNVVQEVNCRHFGICLV